MKERKVLSKAQVRFRIGICLCLLVTTVASLFLWDYLDTKTDAQAWIQITITFSLALLSVVVALSALPSSLTIDFEQKMELYQKKPLTELSTGSLYEIESALQAMGFQPKGGYWTKRQFNCFRMGFVHYFVGFAANNEELKWLQTMDDVHYKRKCLCAVVFITRTGITAEDEVYLRNIAMDFISDEILAPRQISNAHICVPVLFDKSECKIRYLELLEKDTRRNSVYALGCHQLRQLIS